MTKLRSVKQMDWSRAVIDSSHVMAAGPKGWPKSGPGPVDRARPGSKPHILVDGQGNPLAVSLTGRNRNGVTQLMLLLAKVLSVAGHVGGSRRRPDRLLADRGFAHDKYRRLVWAQGIKPVIARRGVPHGSGLGAHCWVVKRTIAWLHGFRRLRSAGNDATTSTKPSSASPPASPPAGTSNALVVTFCKQWTGRQRAVP
ncbi:transposase [Streptomyces sp. NPDC059202]|uniref:transposase n=1 Tax=Streptomyces sp. NPDC059202 TaxID=3346768 RepID=UPI003696F752